MNIDTNALMQAKDNIDNQIKKYEEAQKEIERLLNVELKKVWVDEASEKLNNKYNNEGKIELEEVKQSIVSFSSELQLAIDEFNETVRNIGEII